MLYKSEWETEGVKWNSLVVRILRDIEGKAATTRNEWTVTDCVSTLSGRKNVG
jgi:hypothetical protein